jgi:membrane-bound lytic murein transglycosylase B
MQRKVYAFFIIAFLFSAAPAYAQTSSADPCSDTTGYLPNETTAQHQARLTTDLAGCEAEETAAQATLTQAQTQSKSLQGDINVLTAQIKVAQLNIQAKNLLIASLGKQISDKQQTIAQLTAQINQGKQTMAELIRKVNELDKVSLPEILLSDQTLTQALSDYDTFASLNAALQSTAAQLLDEENQTQSAENDLTTQQGQQEDALATIQQDKANIQQAQSAKTQLLAVSKGNEATYSQVVAQRQAKAASIRAALFALAGGSKAIPFGQALQYAQAASAKTGVSPAFLLAILTQESNLGANVGQCYVTNFSTGAGVSAKTGTVIAKVMSPTRDTTPFQTITNALGIDPTKQVVSCPQSIGWGGAMGPAQFIPSTWVLLQSRIATALGEPLSAVNPWNPQDAFTASALYLGDLGASSGTYTGEKTAACKYYSGQACGNVTGATGYANSVLALMNSIQLNEINPLEGL